MLRRAACCLTLLLAGCADAGPHGRMVGSVTPQTPGPGCSATTGMLTLDGKVFQFEPDEGVLVIQGSVGPDGALHGRGEQSGSDHKPFVTTFDGKLTGKTVQGTLKDPRCTSQVALVEGGRTLLQDVLRH
jgi:hypothetical protein